MLLTGFQEDQDAVLSSLMIGFLPALFWVQNEVFRSCLKTSSSTQKHFVPRTKFLTQIHRLKTAVVIDGNQSPPPRTASDKPERFSPLLCSQRRAPDFP